MNDKTNSFEAMKAELIEAGYEIRENVNGGMTGVKTPAGYVCLHTFYEKALDKAYAHLREHREIKALRKRLHEIETYALACMNTNHARVAEAASDIYYMARQVRVGDVTGDVPERVQKAYDIADSESEDTE